MGQALSGEEGLRMHAMEHGEGGQSARLQAGGGVDGDGAGGASHRAAVARVEEVAVASSPVGEAALGVAAGGEGARRQGQGGAGAAGVVRVGQGHRPGTIRGGGVGGQVAGQFHQGGMTFEAGQGAVHGVFFADAAQVDGHAGGETQARTVPVHPLPTHPREEFGDGLGGRRAALTVDGPGAGEEAGGDVEQAVGEAVAGGGVVEEVGSLLVHRDPGAGAGVDATDDAVAPEAAEFGLDATDLRQGGLEAVAATVAGMVEENTPGTAHGGEAGLQPRPAAVDLRGGRGRSGHARRRR